MEAWTLAPRHWVLIIFIASALYVHLRGKVRFGLVRALTDFTVLLAPFNALMYLFSRAPATAYLDPKRFKELEVLQQNWQVIREEALKLNDELWQSVQQQQRDADEAARQKKLKEDAERARRQNVQLRGDTPAGQPASGKKSRRDALETAYDQHVGGRV